jgi:hypothetical protein
MAVRIVALLIPLAITVPMLQMTRPQNLPAQEDLVAPPSATEPAWTPETRRVAEAAVTRVVLELPAQDAVRTIETPAADTAQCAASAGVTPQERKASPRRAAPKLAHDGASAKLVNTAGAQGRLATHRAKRALADAGCAPNVHCAPVVVAKVTPVMRRPL